MASRSSRRQFLGQTAALGAGVGFWAGTSPVLRANDSALQGLAAACIGVGGKGPAPFRVKTVFGTRTVHQRVDLDEGTLKKVARIGNGKYFRATDTERLSEIYGIIDRERKTEVKVKEFFHFRELYPYFLIPALLLLGLEVFLKTTILRVIP